MITEAEIGKFDTRLQCNVVRLNYDFCSRSGVAEFSKYNCCDMQGIINLFTAIDSSVLAIQTYSGSEKDTAYKLINRKWWAL